jgi:O-antigen/teichoic acid export membrane protein
VEDPRDSDSHVAAPNAGAFPETAAGDILDTAVAGGAVIRGSVLRVGSYVASVGLNVVAAALLIRHLGASDFGRYMTVISLVTIVAGVTEAGMTSIGVREYSLLSPASRDALMRNLLGLRVVLTLCGVLVALVFARAAGYGRTMVIGTALGGVGLLVTVWQATYGVPLQSRLRLGWVATLELLRQVVTVVVIVALVVAGASLLALLGVPLIAAVVVLVVTAALVRGTIPLRPSFERREYRRLLEITVPYAAATAVGVLYAYLVVVVMSLVSTQRETGYFSASFRIFIALGGLTGALVTSAFPVLARAARDDQRRLRYALQRLWEVCVILGAGLAICSAVGARFAIDVVAGPGFERSVTVLRIQAPAVLATYLVACGGFALLSIRQHKAILVANTLALVASAATVVALSPSYGAVGGAAANVVGEVLLATSYAVALLRARPDLRVSLEIVPRLFVACCLAVGVGLVPGLPPFWRLVAAALVYSVAVAVLRVIPAEIWDTLRERLRRPAGAQ